MPDSLAVRFAKLSPPEPTGTSPLARVSQVLDSFASRDHTGEVLTAVRHYPARQAQWADFPEWLQRGPSRCLQRERHQPALHPPGRCGGSRPCREECRYCHTDCLGQNSLLQLASARRHFR